jgi:transcriptional regulator of nitric oxide reductase
MLTFTIAGYLFLIYINPNFVKETYLLDHLSRILILGIPIEELIWFFFAGMGISAFQKIIWNNHLI